MVVRVDLLLLGMRCNDVFGYSVVAATKILARCQAASQAGEEQALLPAYLRNFLSLSQNRQPIPRSHELVAPSHAHLRCCPSSWCLLRCYCFHPVNMSPQGVNRALSMSPSPFADAASSPPNNEESTESSPFKISLWLLPPEDIRTHLQSNIDDIAALTGGPSFVPHATILGGVPCLCSTENEAEQWAEKLLTTLRTQLPAVGGIPCQFGLNEGCRPHCVLEDGKILNGNNDDNNAADGVSSSCNVKWNQSAVSIMNRSPQFAKAVQLTYRAVCKTDESLGGGTVPLPSEEEINTFDWTTTLKPPLCQPHYSIAYGNHPDLIFAKRNNNNNVGEGYLAEVPPDFVSTEAMLIWTWPASLEGVPTWREVGRIPLC